MVIDILRFATKTYCLERQFCIEGSTNLPLVVSLSLTRKVPLLFSKLSSSLSESRRVILPKYHLVRLRQKTWDTWEQVGEGKKMYAGGREGMIKQG